VFAAAKGASDGVVLDQSRGAFAPGASPEADGNSELELVLSGQAGHLSVFGTPADDVIRVRSADRLIPIGAIDFGTDTDDDVTFTASDVALVGGDGADTLSGQGYSLLGDGARLPLAFSGNAGNDTLDTVDGNPELVSGGPDVDSAVRDGGDILSGVESATLGSTFPGSLAGASLRVAVEATDLHGHTQIERDAGRIRVT